MKMRHVLGAGLVLALVSLVIVQVRNRDAVHEVRPPALPKAPPAVPFGTSSTMAVPPSGSIPTRDSLVGQPALAAPKLSELSTTESPSIASRIGSPNTKPEQEAQVVLDLLKVYRRLFGAFPAGENNQQFVNALLGANKEKLPLLPHDHPRLNANGELVDAWDTPFFFHQNSRTSVEVRSAGPDRLMYTDDDIVAGSPHAHPEISAVADDATRN